MPLASPISFDLARTGNSRILKTILALLTVIAGSSVSGYELYGPRWYAGWQYGIDSACPREIQARILDRTAAISEIVELDHISTSTAFGSAYDKSSQFYCSADFSQSLIYVPEGVNYSSFDVESATGNLTLGRAHLWWIGEEIVEVDIQIDPTLKGWLLSDVLDHEILHGLGCSHSSNPDALMHARITEDKGHHYDDFLCLHELYDIQHSLIDYLGNVFIPDARRFGESESVWGVLVPDIVLESGENNGL